MFTGFWLLAREYKKLTAENKKISEDLDTISLLKEQLVYYKERMQLSQSIGLIGNWEYNIEKSELWASEETFKIHGIDEYTEFIFPLTLELKIRFSMPYRLFV